MATSRKRKSKDTEIALPIKASDSLPSQTTSTVFISHDTRDAELAEAFSKLLVSVSAGLLKTFRSSDRKGSQGIEYGAEWYPDIMEKLKKASDVVCLLTQRSVERPWILFEAGVAKGKLDTPVLGIALGIPLSRAITGPFAQFQNCDDEKDSLTKLVLQLIRRIPDAAPDREAIEMHVRHFGQTAQEILEKLDTDKGVAEQEEPTNDTSVSKLFEEVKVMFQDLPSRIEKRIGPIHRRKHKKFHPSFFEEVFHLSRTEFADPIVGILVLLSAVREELPWIYEIGVDFYRKLQQRNFLGASKSLHNLRVVIELLRHPIFNGLASADAKETHYALRALPEILERYIDLVRSIKPTIESQRRQTGLGLFDPLKQPSAPKKKAGVKERRSLGGNE